MNPPPRVFISYAHESNEHSETVRDLWIFLRTHGVDARLDRLAAQDRQDWALWMGDEIRAADHILLIASLAYKQRAEGRAGSDEGRAVQWEARLIREAFYRDQRKLNRFVPVVLPGQSSAGLPDFMAPLTSSVYHVRRFTVEDAEPLLRLLLGRPAETPVPMGPPPDLDSRDHTLSGTALHHQVTLDITPEPDGGIRTRTLLGGTLLGERAARIPERSDGDQVTVFGHQLWDALFDETTGRRLVSLIDDSPRGSDVIMAVRLAEGVTDLPIEQLRQPDGRKVVTEPEIFPTGAQSLAAHVVTVPPSEQPEATTSGTSPDEQNTKRRRGFRHPRTPAVAPVVLVAVTVVALMWVGITHPWSSAGATRPDNHHDTAETRSAATSSPPPSPSASPPPPTLETTGPESLPALVAPSATTTTQPSAPDPLFNEAQDYHFQNPDTTACLGYRSGYAPTVQTLCGVGERFSMSSSGNGYRILDREHSGDCLVPDDDGKVVNADLTTSAPCGADTTAPNVLWNVEPLDHGTYRLRSELNNNLCLTAKDTPPEAHGKPAPRFADCAPPGTSEYSLQLWAIT